MELQIAIRLKFPKCLKLKSKWIRGIEMKVIRVCGQDSFYLLSNRTFYRINREFCKYMPTYTAHWSIESESYLQNLSTA